MLDKAIIEARDQLTVTWMRRDVADGPALQCRSELLALQRVEQNLTRLMQERKT